MAKHGRGGNSGDGGRREFSCQTRGSGSGGGGDVRPKGHRAEGHEGAKSDPKPRAKGSGNSTVGAVSVDARPVKRQKIEHGQSQGGNGKLKKKQAQQQGQKQGQRRSEKKQHAAPAPAATPAAPAEAAADVATKAARTAAAAAADAAGAAHAAAAAAEAAATAATTALPGGRRVPNSNWEVLKQAVAAAKKPPPPEHVQKRRAAAAAAAAAASGGAAAGAAAAAAAAPGRRPGLVGSETGITKVLALDCEMVGVGSGGLESALARVSLVNNAGAVLLDTFVQPKEKVTDYRTWVSGVRPSDLVNARPYDEVVQQVGEMVKGRILVGHALGNDLRILRLEEHPRALLRDTSRYPGLMKELPGGRKVAASLKDLAATHLGLAIQQGEHSPVDDARAAMYLYQKVHREWEAALKSGQLKPVVSGLHKRKTRPATGPRSRKDARGRGAQRRRSEKGSGAGKDMGALGVAGGGIRKHDRRAGKRGGGREAHSGAKPLWSLEGDPYADL